MDPAKDKRVNSGFYAVMPNPADGSIWGASIGYPGAVVRLNPGANPPETALAEVYTPPTQPSPYWGNEAIWDSQANAHNPMLDEEGRVWYTAVVRAPGNMPDYCRAESGHPSAKLFPLERSGRQLSVYDPKTEKYTFVDTCYSTHHLQFAEDANDTLWTSGGGQVVGWLNSKLFLETGDAGRSQGWTALVLDTNGNGRRDEYVEPN